MLTTHQPTIAVLPKLVLVSSIYAPTNITEILLSYIHALDMILETFVSCMHICIPYAINGIKSDERIKNSSSIIILWCILTLQDEALLLNGNYIYYRQIINRRKSKNREGDQCIQLDLCVSTLFPSLSQCTIYRFTLYDLTEIY